MKNFLTKNAQTLNFRQRYELSARSGLTQDEGIGGEEVRPFSNTRSASLLEMLATLALGVRQAATKLETHLEEAHLRPLEGHGQPFRAAEFWSKTRKIGPATTWDSRLLSKGVMRCC